MKSNVSIFLSCPHGSSLIKSPLHHILNLSHPSLCNIFFSSLSLSLFHTTSQTKNGEILKGAWSSTHTRMEGGLCQLQAAQEIHQNDQSQKSFQPNTASKRNLWSFHFRSRSLRIQQALQFTQQQHARYRSGELYCNKEISKITIYLYSL